MRAQFERESALESPWTSYNPSLGRPLLNSAKFLAKATPPPEQVVAAAAASGTTPTLPGFEPEAQNGDGGMLPIRSETVTKA
jgi:hypothetical protein